MVSRGHEVRCLQSHLRDMMAPKGEFDNTSTSPAPLPALLLSETQRVVQSCVSRTVTVVAGGLAHSACGRVALWTESNVVCNEPSSNEFCAHCILTVGTLADVRIELFLLLLESSGQPAVDS